MPVEIKKDGACDGCKKLGTETSPITHYKKHGDNLLLCPKCLEARERPYIVICPKCKKVAYEHGGMSFYGEYPEDFEDMCVECVEKKEVREAKRNAIKLKTKIFLMKNWKYWISTGLIIVGLVMAYFSFLSTK